MLGGSHRPTTFSYISLSEDNSESAASVGGQCEKLVNVISGGVNLNIGDIVYYTAGPLGSVTKSATIANYTNVIAGVVVGGHRTYGSVIQDDAVIGTLAAMPGESVIVAYDGIVKVKSAAAFAVFAGLGVTTTSGQPGTNVTAGQRIGVALQVAGGANVVVKVKLRIA